MEYEDTITVATAEGIELSFTLAGLGSRFLAQLGDGVIRAVLMVAALFAAAALGGGSLAVIPAILIGFLIVFVYDIAFEVWGSGRTPGKRWCALRVLTVSGQPVGLASSAVRNLLRIVDVWSTIAIVGTVSILVTRRNQRLGDLAAGTIVVREPRLRAATAGEIASAAPAGVDVTGVSADELALVRDFLARREGLAEDARERVALALAQRLGDKVGGLPPGTLAPEMLLETIAAAKAAGPSSG